MFLKRQKPPVSDTAFGPAVRSHINAVPVAKIAWQAAPLAAMLGYIQVA